MYSNNQEIRECQDKSIYNNKQEIREYQDKSIYNNKYYIKYGIQTKYIFWGRELDSL